MSRPLAAASEIEFVVVATFRRHSLAGEMLVLQLAIVVVVLLAVAAVSSPSRRPPSTASRDAG